MAAVILFKAIAYAVSLGSGFRGGPFFPAMFIGAATGLLCSLVLSPGPSVPAAMAVGLVAAIIATARMTWLIAVILAVVIGFFMGGWTLLPAVLIAALVSRAVPRWGDRLASQPSTRRE